MKKLLSSLLLFSLLKGILLAQQTPGLDLPPDWRSPFIWPERQTYTFGNEVYDPSIDANFTNIYNNGPGNHATNQQPSVAVKSDGTMVVVWTQASRESEKDQSVVSSTSYDGGKTWMAPVDIERAADKRPGSWAMVFCVPHTGRFYTFYWYDENQNVKRDAGRIYFRFSDDTGQTWSKRYPIPMPRHSLDNKGEDIHGWNTGFPLLMPDGAMLMGFTKMSSDLGVEGAIRAGALHKTDGPGSIGSYPQYWNCEVFFLRAENILTESDPEKLLFNVTPSGSEGLWFHDDLDNKLHFLQEPFMALLPSGKVICTMRVMNGYPVYSVSNDYGKTWSKPLPLRNRPGGELLRHVCGPCQISSSDDGRIYFLFSNRNDYSGDGWSGRWLNRDPMHVVVGRELPLLTKGIPEDKQNAGIYFDSPRIILSGLEDKKFTNDLSKTFGMKRSAQYPQLLHLGKRHLIFYSNTKMDIRVKEVPDALVTGIGIPAFPQ